MSYQFLSEYLRVSELLNIYTECEKLLEARISYGPVQRRIIARAEKLISKNKNKARVYLHTLQNGGSIKGRYGSTTTGGGKIQLITRRLEDFKNRAERLKKVITKVQDEARLGKVY